MGEDLAGRTILVRAEQNSATPSSSAAICPASPSSARRSGLICDPRLIPLLRTLPGSVVLTPRGAPLPRYDVWTDQMSLPRLFGTTPETILAASGYLQADPAWAAAWRHAAGRAAHRLSSWA